MNLSNSGLGLGGEAPRQPLDPNLEAPQQMEIETKGAQSEPEVKGTVDADQERAGKRDERTAQEQSSEVTEVAKQAFEPISKFWADAGIAATKLTRFQRFVRHIRGKSTDATHLFFERQISKISQIGLTISKHQAKLNAALKQVDFSKFRVLEVKPFTEKVQKQMAEIEMSIEGLGKQVANLMSVNPEEDRPGSLNNLFTSVQTELANLKKASEESESLFTAKTASAPKEMVIIQEESLKAQSDEIIKEFTTLTEREQDFVEKICTRGVGSQDLKEFGIKGYQQLFKKLGYQAFTKDDANAKAQLVMLVTALKSQAADMMDKIEGKAVGYSKDLMANWRIQQTLYEVPELWVKLGLNQLNEGRYTLKGTSTSIDFLQKQFKLVLVQVSTAALKSQNGDLANAFLELQKPIYPLASTVNRILQEREFKELDIQVEKFVTELEIQANVKPFIAAVEQLKGGKEDIERLRNVLKQLEERGLSKAAFDHPQFAAAVDQLLGIKAEVSKNLWDALCLGYIPSTVSAHTLAETLTQFFQTEKIDMAMLEKIERVRPDAGGTLLGWGYLHAAQSYIQQGQMVEAGKNLMHAEERVNALINVPIERLGGMLHSRLLTILIPIADLKEKAHHFTREEAKIFEKVQKKEAGLFKAISDGGPEKQLAENVLNKIKMRLMAFKKDFLDGDGLATLEGWMETINTLENVYDVGKDRYVNRKFEAWKEANQAVFEKLAAKEKEEEFHLVSEAPGAEFELKAAAEGQRPLGEIEQAKTSAEQAKQKISYLYSNIQQLARRCGLSIEGFDKLSPEALEEFYEGLVEFEKKHATLIDQLQVDSFQQNRTWQSGMASKAAVASVSPAYVTRELYENIERSFGGIPVVIKLDIFDKEQRQGNLLEGPVQGAPFPAATGASSPNVIPHYAVGYIAKKCFEELMQAAHPKQVGEMEVKGNQEKRKSSPMLDLLARIQRDDPRTWQLLTADPYLFPLLEKVLNTVADSPEKTAMEFRLNVAMAIQNRKPGRLHPALDIAASILSQHGFPLDLLAELQAMAQKYHLCDPNPIQYKILDELRKENPNLNSIYKIKNWETEVRSLHDILHARGNRYNGLPEEELSWNQADRSLLLSFFSRLFPEVNIGQVAEPVTRALAPKEAANKLAHTAKTPLNLPMELLEFHLTYRASEPGIVRSLQQVRQDFHQKADYSRDGNKVHQAAFQAYKTLRLLDTLIEEFDRNPGKLPATMAQFVAEKRQLDSLLAQVGQPTESMEKAYPTVAETLKNVRGLISEKLNAHLVNRLSAEEERDVQRIIQSDKPVQGMTKERTAHLLNKYNLALQLKTDDPNFTLLFQQHWPTVKMLQQKYNSWYDKQGTLVRQMFTDLNAFIDGNPQLLAFDELVEFKQTHRNYLLDLSRRLDTMDAFERLAEREGTASSNYMYLVDANAQLDLAKFNEFMEQFKQLEDVPPNDPWRKDLNTLQERAAKIRFHEAPILKQLMLNQTVPSDLKGLAIVLAKTQMLSESQLKEQLKDILLRNSDEPYKPFKDLLKEVLLNNRDGLYERLTAMLPDNALDFLGITDQEIAQAKPQPSVAAQEAAAKGAAAQAEVKEAAAQKKQSVLELLKKIGEGKTRQEINSNIAKFLDTFGQIQDPMGIKQEISNQLKDSFFTLAQEDLDYLIELPKGQDYIIQERLGQIFDRIALLEKMDKLFELPPSLKTSLQSYQKQRDDVKKYIKDNNLPFVHAEMEQKAAHAEPPAAAVAFGPPQQPVASSPLTPPLGQQETKANAEQAGKTGGAPAPVLSAAIPKAPMGTKQLLAEAKKQLQIAQKHFAIIKKSTPSKRAIDWIPNKFKALFFAEQALDRGKVALSQIDDLKAKKEILSAILSLQSQLDKIDVSNNNVPYRLLIEFIAKETNLFQIISTQMKVPERLSELFEIVKTNLLTDSKASEKAVCKALTNFIDVVKIFLLRSTSLDQHPDLLKAALDFDENGYLGLVGIDHDPAVELAWEERNFSRPVQPPTLAAQEAEPKEKAASQEVGSKVGAETFGPPSASVVPEGTPVVQERNPYLSDAQRAAMEAATQATQARMEALRKEEEPDFLKMADQQYANANKHFDNATQLIPPDSASKPRVLDEWVIQGFKEVYLAERALRKCKEALNKMDEGKIKEEKRDQVMALEGYLEALEPFRNDPIPKVLSSNIVLLEAFETDPKQNPHSFSAISKLVKEKLLNKQNATDGEVLKELANFIDFLTLFVMRRPFAHPEQTTNIIGYVVALKNFQTHYPNTIAEEQSIQVALLYNDWERSQPLVMEKVFSKLPRQSKIKISADAQKHLEALKKIRVEGQLVRDRKPINEAISAFLNASQNIPKNIPLSEDFEKQLTELRLVFQLAKEDVEHLNKIAEGAAVDDTQRLEELFDRIALLQRMAMSFKLPQALQKDLDTYIEQRRIIKQARKGLQRIVSQEELRNASERGEQEQKAAAATHAERDRKASAEPTKATRPVKPSVSQRPQGSTNVSTSSKPPLRPTKPSWLEKPSLLERISRRSSPTRKSTAKTADEGKLEERIKKIKPLDASNVASIQAYEKLYAAWKALPNSPEHKEKLKKSLLGKLKLPPEKVNEMRLQIVNRTPNKEMASNFSKLMINVYLEIHLFATYRELRTSFHDEAQFNEIYKLIPPYVRKQFEEFEKSRQPTPPPEPVQRQPSSGIPLGPQSAPSPSQSSDSGPLRQPQPPLPPLPGAVKEEDEIDRGIEGFTPPAPPAPPVQ